VIAMTKRVLCAGRNQRIMDSVLIALRGAGFDAEGAVTIDAAVELAARGAYDALLVGGGIVGDERAELVERVQAIQPHIALAFADGGPHTALDALRAAIG
jgi:DNA-binding NtrC family response regulator